MVIGLRLEISQTRVKQIVKILYCSEAKACRLAYYEQLEAQNRQEREDKEQLEKARTDPEEFKKLLMKAMRQK